MSLKTGREEEEEKEEKKGREKGKRSAEKKGLGSRANRSLSTI